MSEPGKVDTSSQPVAAGEKPQLYKCLLNQYSQKLWKQLPIYQTRNEGSDHLPKFRSSVWVNGVTYTSPNTFGQRKLADMDATKVAFFATMHKLKDEASRLVREDLFFCKSIVVEYAARMNIQKPTYQTVQLDTPLPVFRSSVVFNDVSCTGDDSRSKKEAEQSAARAVILKYLDSESGNVMSEIIMCKFQLYAKGKDTPSAQTGTNAVVQTGSDNGVTSNEAKIEEGTKMPNTSAALPEPFLVQSTTIPATHLSMDVTQTHIPEVSTQALAPVIPVPTVLAQTPYAGTNNAPTSSLPSALSLEHFASIPPTPPLPLSAPALAQAPVVSATSGKKRNRKNKKKAQKKMRVDDEPLIPAIALSQAPTFLAQ